ncbi:MAG: helix-turn-helix domain-containing protein [Methanomassiliicoccus sp.]|nr:helix-turn-helix domain-containing protein [Methanomassiliicoccus sp.]
MSVHKSISAISSCRDIIQCAYNLNDLEVEVFRAASRQGPWRADELADQMGKERSTVYRALQKLISCGMCVRETRSMEKGGYYHVYSAIPHDVLRGRLELCVEEWSKRMKDVLARFDENYAME